MVQNRSVNIIQIYLKNLIFYFFIILKICFFKSCYADVDPYKENVEQKIKETQTLALNAHKYFSAQPLDVAIRDFTYKPIWYKGDVSVFVLDDKGTFYTAGMNTDLIWRSLKVVAKTDEDATLKSSILKPMLHVGNKGGRYSYVFSNAYNSAYVKNIVKDGKRYIVGSGFFPQSNAFTAEQLVKTAVSYFYAEGVSATFEAINNPAGIFVVGDIYVSAYDFDGNVMGHSQNPAWVGQNLIDEKDQKGKSLFKARIDLAKSKGSGWIEYYQDNALKKTYVERVVDPKTGKSYFFSAGFYPEINLTAIKRLVSSAIMHMKVHGTQKAFADFTSKIGRFKKGGVGIFVYNFEGVSLANGEEPAFVGQNLINRTDQDGKFIVKEMIDLARRKESGLIYFREDNSYAVAYIKRVKIPEGEFIVGAEFFPASKAVATKTLVERAAKYLQDHSITKAFHDFSKRGGSFVVGDQSIFVYDLKGTRYVNGIHKQNIWKNYLRTTDQVGRTVVADTIAAAINGNGWMEYNTRNSLRRIFVKVVDKQISKNVKKRFIIGSGYFI